MGGGEFVDTRVERPGDVLLVEQVADDDGLEVHWLYVEREERPLKTQYVPLGNLVTAGHSQETLPFR